jgi:hypothetical protein
MQTERQQKIKKENNKDKEHKSKIYLEWIHAMLEFVENTETTILEKSVTKIHSIHNGTYTIQMK